jgi:hypothetical protein
MSTVDTNPDVERNCREAQEALDRALNDGTSQAAGTIDEAERALVRARDAVNERLRQDAGAPLQPTLNCLNAILSLIAAVEYPTDGVPYDRMRQARDALNDVMANLPR